MRRRLGWSRDKAVGGRVPPGNSRAGGGVVSELPFDAVSLPAVSVTQDAVDPAQDRCPPRVPVPAGRVGKNEVAVHAFLGGPCSTSAIVGSPHSPNRRDRGATCWPWKGGAVRRVLPKAAPREVLNSTQDAFLGDMAYYNDVLFVKESATSQLLFNILS